MVIAIHAWRPVTVRDATLEPVGMVVPEMDAGWYPDPTGKFDQRYFDGRDWTIHVARGAELLRDTPPQPADAPTAAPSGSAPASSEAERSDATPVVRGGASERTRWPLWAKVALALAIVAIVAGVVIAKAVGGGGSARTTSTGAPSTTAATTTTSTTVVTTTSTTVPSTTTSSTRPPTTAAPTTTAAATTAPPTTAPPVPPCVAKVSDGFPPRDTDVLVGITSGQPNALITATAHFRSTDATKTNTANAAGAGSVTFSIGAASPGYRVVVDITVGNTSCSTGFTPV